MANIPQFTPNWGAIGNITPFTHRDNATYLTMLHDLSQYLTVTLIPTINEEFSEQRVASTGEVVDLLVQVNALIETLNTTNISAEDALVEIQAINASLPNLNTLISEAESYANAAQLSANGAQLSEDNAQASAAEAATARESLPSTATKRVLDIIHAELTNAEILVVSDSTTNDTNEWVYQLFNQIASDWPKHTVLYRLWNDTNGTYDNPLTLSTGTGTKTLTVFNAAISGGTALTWTGERAKLALYGLDPTLIMLSMGHNEGNISPELWRARYMMLTENLTWNLPNADLLCIMQNPASDNTRQQQRAIIYQEIAVTRGFGFIDVGQAFIDTGNAAALSIDGVHPNAAGTTLWVDTVKPSFKRVKNSAIHNQPESTLSMVGDNLLVNSTFSEGATMLENWVLTGGATSARDTVNFESSELQDRTTGTERATDSTSVKFTAISGASSVLSQWIPTKRLKPGTWVTVAARIFVANGMPVTTARLGFGGNANGSGILNIHASNIVANDGFTWIIHTTQIPENLENFRVLVYIDSGTTTAGACTIDRIVMTPSKLPYGA